MNFVEYILKRTTPRVSAPEALGVSSGVVATLSEASEVAPRTLQKLTPSESQLVIDSIKHAGEETVEAAAAMAKGAQAATPLDYVDIIAAQVKAVIIGELQRHYTNWKHLNLGKWQQELTAWANANPVMDLSLIHI